MTDLIQTDLVSRLHSMGEVEINEIAFQKLEHLLERCTMHLVTKLTGISRPTLYRWMDTERGLEAMNARDAAWFILLCETSPRLKMLMQRPPLSHPRLAGRLFQDADTQGESNEQG